VKSFVSNIHNILATSNDEATVAMAYNLFTDKNNGGFQEFDNIFPKESEVVVDKPFPKRPKVKYDTIDNYEFPIIHETDNTPADNEEVERIMNICLGVSGYISEIDIANQLVELQTKGNESSCLASIIYDSINGILQLHSLSSIEIIYTQLLEKGYIGNQIIHTYPQFIPIILNVHRETGDYAFDSFKVKNILGNSISSLPQSKEMIIINFMSKFGETYKNIQSNSVNMSKDDYIQIIRVQIESLKATRSKPKLLANIFALISLCNYSGNIKNLDSRTHIWISPHMVHIIGLYLLLEKEKGEYYNQIFNDNGEGNEIILGILSIIHALQGSTVYCVSKYQEQCERNKNMFQFVLKTLEIENNVKYCTVFQMAENMINESGCIRQKTNNLFTESLSKENFNRKENNNVLLLDGANNVLIDETFYGSNHRLSIIIKNTITFNILQKNLEK